MVERHQAVAPGAAALAVRGYGRGRIQYLASLFHPETPKDTAPGGYNDPSVPAGLPPSPLEPVKSRDVV